MLTAVSWCTLQEIQGLEKRLIVSQQECWNLRDMLVQQRASAAVQCHGSSMVGAATEAATSKLTACPGQAGDMCARGASTHMNECMPEDMDATSAGYSHGPQSTAVQRNKHKQQQQQQQVTPSQPQWLQLKQQQQQKQQRTSDPGFIAPHTTHGRHAGVRRSSSSTSTSQGDRQDKDDLLPCKQPIEPGGSCTHQGRAVTKTSQPAGRGRVSSGQAAKQSAKSSQSKRTDIPEDPSSSRTHGRNSHIGQWNAAASNNKDSNGEAVCDSGHSEAGGAAAHATGRQGSQFKGPWSNGDVVLQAAHTCAELRQRHHDSGAIGSKSSTLREECAALDGTHILGAYSNASDGLNWPTGLLNQSVSSNSGWAGTAQAMPRPWDAGDWHP